MAATSRAGWRKSTRSNGGEDSCVEVATLARYQDGGLIDGRESKHPDARSEPSQRRRS
jgi:hypothetical protein